MTILSFFHSCGKEFLVAQEKPFSPPLSGLTISLYIFTMECGVEVIHVTLGPDS